MWEFQQIFGPSQRGMPRTKERQALHSCPLALHQRRNLLKQIQVAVPNRRRRQPKTTPHVTKLYFKKIERLPEKNESFRLKPHHELLSKRLEERQGDRMLKFEHHQIYWGSKKQHLRNAKLVNPYELLTKSHSLYQPLGFGFDVLSSVCYQNVTHVSPCHQYPAPTAARSEPKYCSLR